MWVMLGPILTNVVKSAGNEKATQKNVIKAIQCLAKHIGVDAALRLLGISRILYNQWLLEDSYTCSGSFTALCTKRYPRQMQVKEVRKIKRMLTSQKYSHWPVASIAGFATREGSLVACLTSWYKFAKIFGIRRKMFKKSKKKVGLNADYPNEYLHVDTTYLPLSDGKKICIAFVMDNYSKMILGYHVSRRGNFYVVKQAIKKALNVIMQHPNQEHSFLVTDGGKENHNQYIDAFISKLTKHRITKIRALKDIRWSNSPVEAIHRTLKGWYLKPNQFSSIATVDKHLQWAVMDYNVLRPHYKHRPRTPQEVYFNTPLGFDLKERVKKAMKKRVKNNKCHGCRECEGACKALKKVSKKS